MMDREEKKVIEITGMNLFLLSKPYSSSANVLNNNQIIHVNGTLLGYTDTLISSLCWNRGTTHSSNFSLSVSLISDTF